MFEKARVAFLALAWGLLALTPAAGGQALSTSSIDLGFDDTIDLGFDAPDNPFAVRLLPGGRGVLVTVAGHVGGTQNNRLDRIDVATGSVQQRVRVGFFPVEIAFRLDGSGDVQSVFVANSSSNTISVLDPLLAPVGTVSLPPGPFFTTFPTGLAIGSGGSRLYVSTADGFGNVFVIDIDDQSGTYLSRLPAEEFVIPGGHGRIAFTPSGELVMPTTIFAADFSLSSAEVFVVDPANPGAAANFVLDAGPTFPLAQDVALDRAGLAWISVHGGGSRLYVLDVAAGALAKTVEVGGSPGQLSLAIEPRGLFGHVSNILDGTVTVFDTRGSAVVQTFAAGSQTNDIDFLRDGSRAYVTDQGGTCLLVVSGLPRPTLDLTGNLLPVAGTTESYLLEGGTEGASGRLLASVSGRGPLPVGNVVLELTPPIFLIASRRFDIDGRAVLGPLTLPPTLPRGLNVFVQGITIEPTGELRVSGGRTVIIQ